MTDSYESVRQNTMLQVTKTTNYHSETGNGSVDINWTKRHVKARCTDLRCFFAEFAKLLELQRLVKVYLLPIKPWWEYRRTYFIASAMVMKIWPSPLPMRAHAKKLSGDLISSCERNEIRYGKILVISILNSYLTWQFFLLTFSRSLERTIDKMVRNTWWRGDKSTVWTCWLSDNKDIKYASYQTGFRQWYILESGYLIYDCSCVKELRNLSNLSDRLVCVLNLLSKHLVLMFSWIPLILLWSDFNFNCCIAVKVYIFLEQRCSV